MAGVIKKGYLEVKTRSKLGPGYKRKFVILQRDAQHGRKFVEIRETETNSEGVEYLPLNGMWTVQDKTSRNSKRYPFEVVIGSEVVMTFSCFSVTDREDWTESFRLLNKLPMHSPPLPTSDMFPVTLERSISSIEVGVSGPCLLYIQDASIVLYSEDGRNKFHHWSGPLIKLLKIEGDQLVLHANRAGGDNVMEFRFNADKAVTRKVMTAWNMAVMQSMSADPEKLNMISQIMQENVSSPTGRGSSSSGGHGEKVTKGNKFFSSAKQKPRPSTEKESSGVRRAHSLTEKSVHTVTSRRSASPDSNFFNRLSTASQHSQDSYIINAASHNFDDEQNSPPPVPPRAPRKPWNMGKDKIPYDPDYSYIKDDDVGVASSTDGSQRELDDLLRDIMEDNHRKKKQVSDRATHRILPLAEPITLPRSSTFGHEAMRSAGIGPGFQEKAKQFFDTYGEARQAGDYLEPVPSKNAQARAPWRGNHTHSLSLPSTHNSSYASDESVREHQRRHENGTMYRESLRAPPPAGNRHSAGPRSFPHHSKSPSPPLPQAPRPSYSATSIATATSVSTTTTSGGLSPTSSKKDISPYAQTSNLRIELGLGLKPEPGLGPKSEPGLGLKPSQEAPAITSATQPTVSPSPPPLPPRSPIKPPRTRYLSSSSTHSSNSSLNHRCPRCNGMKNSTKTSIGKTISLNDHHHHVRGHTHKEMLEDMRRGSLPDLHQSHSVPENSLGSQGTQEDSESSSTHSSNDTDIATAGLHSTTSTLKLRNHTHHTTISPPTSPPHYLQIVEDRSSHDSLDSTLAMMDSFVKDLEYLESKVSKGSSISSSGSAHQQKKSVPDRTTDLDAALKQVHQVQSDLLVAKNETRKKSETIHRSISAPKTTPTGAPGLRGKPRSMTIHHSATRLHTGTNHMINGGSTIHPPNVPPRSHVSLNQHPTSRLISQLSAPSINISGQHGVRQHGHPHLTRHSAHGGKLGEPHLYRQIATEIKRSHC